MNVFLKKSGISSRKIKAPILRDGNFFDDFRMLVKEGRSLVNTLNQQAFRNCVFNVADLRKIASQANCTHLIFSHISVEDEEIDALKYSTAAVFGRKEFSFLLKEEVYFSVDFDVDLDFSKISAFDQSQNLQWHSTTDVDFELAQTGKNWIETLGPTGSASINSFEDWIEQFNDVEEVIVNGIPNEADTVNEKLVKGVYFNIDQLNALDLLEEGNGPAHLALFPVTLETKERSGDFDLNGTTYVLVPIYESNVLSYSRGHTAFPISDYYWPRNWNVVGGG